MCACALACVFSLAACAEPAITTKDDGGGGNDTEDSDTGDTGAELSPFTGSWSGIVDGYAAFQGYEGQPYCEGDVSGAALTTGELEVTGTCIILYGPYTDDEFSVSITGTVNNDGSGTLNASLPYATEERSWDEATLTVTADATARTINATGETMYNPAGLDPIAATITVALE